MNFTYLFEKENPATSYGVYFGDDRTLHTQNGNDSDVCGITSNDFSVQVVG